MIGLHNFNFAPQTYILQQLTSNKHKNDQIQNLSGRMEAPATILQEVIVCVQLSKSSKYAQARKLKMKVPVS
jgi:hypothetical protein